MDYRPDIVILDLLRPEIGGSDVPHETRTTGIAAKIILTSGFGRTCLRIAQVVARFNNAGQSAGLKRPFRRRYSLTCSGA